jgi:hypothetical protein
MVKIFKNKFFWLILTLVLTVPAFSFLLRPGLYYNMHDDMQMIRQLEMEKCLQDGQIPCRWTPDLGYGYGYPLFNFYPPMPYIVGQVYRTFGLSFMDTVKATAVTQIVLSSLFMFILSSSIFGEVGGFLSALFYTYAPYHAVNIYVRGAMDEAWAAVFFPLIFYFSRRLILENKKKFIVGFAVSFAGLLLSHNPMALTFTPILFIWVLFWLLTKYQKPFFSFIKDQLPIILKLVLSGIFTTCLVAFFTIPVILETKYVQIDSMFTGYYNFSVHFATLYQIFLSNFWGDGASVWGPNDGMSFAIGYLHWIIPVLILFFIIFLTIKNRKSLKKIDSRFWLLVVLILMGFFTAFMTHNKSTFIWLLFPIIQKIQFPWRFLSHTVFLFSLSVGGLVLILKSIPKKIQAGLISLIVILLFVLNVSHFTPLEYGPLTDTQKFSGKAWINEVTSGIYDYLPKTARIAAQGPAKDFVDQIDPATTTFTITNSKKGSDWTLFDLNISQKSEVTLSQMAFPEFKVTDNGQPINYKIEPELGRIIVDLNAGNHQLLVKFTNTPIRTVSNYISLAAWLVLGIFLLKPLWNKLISKK